MITDRGDVVEKEGHIWTTEQVQKLWEYQNVGTVHPFTCPNRDSATHFNNGIDLGGLIPTRRGWICQCCDYKQNWAHDFMFKGAPPPPEFP